MSPILISSVLGLALTVMALNQIAPSVTAIMTAKKSEVGAGREEDLAQQILQYRATEGSYPADVAAMVTKNYWRTADNNNGLGGTYSFTVDTAKGLIAISTNIADAAQCNSYVASYRHVFKPVATCPGTVTTTFVVPSSNITGAMASANKSITVSASAPNAATNSYWYDTSGTTAVLKVSNGSTWSVASAATTVNTTPNAANIVASANDLPISASVGDVRYVYSQANSSLDTLVYYNGAWTQTAIAQPPATVANPVANLAGTAATLTGYIAEAFSFDFKTVVSSIFTSNLATNTVNPANVSWAIQGALPAGLSLSSTGVLSGTPTQATAAAGTTLNVLATYQGSTGSQGYTLKVGPAFLRATQVQAGVNHNCALTTAGGVKCWGINWNGGLGDGTTTHKTNGMVDVVGLTSGVSAIGVGDQHSCALTTAGVVKCWGYNTYGQLGDGTTTRRLTPITVPLTTASMITVGAHHTCALLVTTAIKCWGYNAHGQLGDTTTTQRNSPVYVSGVLDSTGLATGVYSQGRAYTTCATFTSGAAKCWGYNGFGGLGDGTTTNRSIPTQVTGLTVGVTKISVGHYHTCAIVSGAAKCWGAGWDGRVGDSTWADRSTPVTATGLTTGVTDISAGESESCAIMSGAAYCWGLGALGQMGNGSMAYSKGLPTPTQITSNASQINVGNNAACAILTDNRVKCWGSNLSYLTARGTQLSTDVPVDVLADAWN